MDITATMFVAGYWGAVSSISFPLGAALALVYVGGVCALQDFFKKLHNIFCLWFDNNINNINTP